MNETNNICCTFFNMSNYTQNEIECICDDYGCDVLLIEENNDYNKSKSIPFTSSKRIELSPGFHSVIMKSNYEDISLVMTFSVSDNSRTLITGHMIKNKILYNILSYDICPEIDSDIIAYARCIYKK